MASKMKILIYSILLATLVSYVGYTKDLSKKATYKKNKKGFLNWINNAYAQSIDEKKILRKKWKDMLGVDIFYPYFKAKEVEDWIKEKARIDFFKLKGEPEFRRNQIQYIFKLKF